MNSSKVSQSEDLKEILTNKPVAVSPPVASSLDRFLSKLISCLPYLSFSFMAYSVVTAIYDSKNDPANLAFVAGSFTLLGLLYFAMWEFERTRSSPSPTKHLVLKAIIWVLSVTLTTVFARRVTTIVDSLTLDIFVWSVAAFTSGCGFYFLFIMAPDQ